jgi:hypothetical protein
MSSAGGSGSTRRAGVIAYSPGIAVAHIFAAAASHIEAVPL